MSPTSCGSVLWSVSSPGRGTRAAIRAASKAHRPATGKVAASLADGLRRNDQVDPERVPRDCRRRPLFEERGGRGVSRIRSGYDSALSRERARQRLHHQYPGQVLDLHPQHEAHRVEVVDEGLGGVRLDVDPGGRAVVRERQVVLKVALRGQDERLRGAAGGEPLQVLAGQAVQPAQPVRAGDLDDAPVGPVDEDLAFRHRALLAHRVAVVRGDALVRPFRLDGAVDLKHCACSYSRCSVRTRSGARRWSRTRAGHRAPWSAARLLLACLVDLAAVLADQVDVAASLARWYVGAPWFRWVWVTRPRLSSSSSVR